MGDATGELAGLECGDPGTNVSELVVVLKAAGLLRDPVKVSEEAPRDKGLGTGRFLSCSGGSVEDSPGSLKVMVVPPGLYGVSGSDSESSDSVTSVKNSEFSERVSHEAMGASLGLGGMRRLVGWSSSSLDLLPLPAFSSLVSFTRSSANKQQL